MWRMHITIINICTYILMQWKLSCKHLCFCFHWSHQRAIITSWHFISAVKRCIWEAKQEFSQQAFPSPSELKHKLVSLWMNPLQLCSVSLIMPLKHSFNLIVCVWRTDPYLLCSDEEMQLCKIYIDIIIEDSQTWVQKSSEIHKHTVYTCFLYSVA